MKFLQYNIMQLLAQIQISMQVLANTSIDANFLQIQYHAIAISNASYLANASIDTTSCKYNIDVTSCKYKYRCNFLQIQVSMQLLGNTSIDAISCNKYDAILMQLLANTSIDASFCKYNIDATSCKYNIECNFLQIQY